ncbi:hypothetical protein ACWGJ2_17215 [Streptomyces sp. NPDC054796]
MEGYRYADEHTPPPPRRAGDVAVERFDHLFEVDPRLMTAHVAQQLFPNWDTLRIAASRTGHLEWMHRHWADTVVSGQALLDESDDLDDPVDGADAPDAP